MGLTSESCKSAWITNLKTQVLLTDIVGQEVREEQYQATDWTYPCIRVCVDFKPSINRCGVDDAYLDIICYSAEKSSKQSVHLASLIQTLYHGKNFSQDGHMFSTVIVLDVSKPMRSIWAWETTVKIHAQGV